MKAEASGIVSLLLLLVPLLNPLLDAMVKDGPGCAIDVIALFLEPTQRIAASAEVIDRQAQLYTSLNATVADAEQVQQALYNATVQSGMDRFPSHLAGIPAAQLRARLSPETLDLSEYSEAWNIAVMDLHCMLEPDCVSVCADGVGCAEFLSVNRGAARLPSQRPDRAIKSYLKQTREKLELFTQAYQDSLKVIEDQREEFLKQQSSLENRLEKANSQITSDYGQTRSILIELDQHYCLRTYPLPEPVTGLNRARATHQQFADLLPELEGNPRYQSPSPGWLYNRVQRLTNASLSLILRNEILDRDVMPSIDNHVSLSECILNQVEQEAGEAVDLSGADRPLLLARKSFCESKLSVPSTIDSQASTAQCLVEYVIKPVKGEAFDLLRIERELELAESLFMVAIAPLDTKIDVNGETLRGEDITSYLSSHDLEELSSSLKAQRAALARLPYLSAKDAASAALKLEEALDRILFNLNVLTNEAHKKRVNSLWSELSLEISKTDARLAWLSDRGISTEVSTQSERDYLSGNSRFMAEEVTAFRAFGHMNRLRHDLSGLMGGLSAKRAVLKPLIASRLQPRVESGPVQARLNQQVRAEFNVYVENPFPDEEFETRLQIIHPLFSRAIDARVGKTGFSAKFEQAVTPITGSESSSARASNYPSNILYIHKALSFSAPVPADLELPVGVVPYDIDCGSLLCEYEDKAVVIEGLEGSGTAIVSIHAENPLKVELGARCGDDQILSVTSTLPFPVDASITLTTESTDLSVYDVVSGSPIGFSRNPARNLVTFTKNLPARSVTWVKLTSSGENSLLSPTALLFPTVKPRASSNHTYGEAMDVLLEARENYHLAKFASTEHPSLVLVNLNFLESLLASAQGKLSKESLDAYDSAGIALEHTSNATEGIATVLYDEVVRIKQAYQNSTLLDAEVSRLAEYRRRHDTENTILLGSQVLKSLAGLEVSPDTLGDNSSSQSLSSSGTEPDSQAGTSGVSYSSSRSALLEPSSPIPWWLPAGAVLGLTGLTVFVLKDKIPRVQQALGEKLDEYEKKAEEDEMAKYNL